MPLLEYPLSNQVSTGIRINPEIPGLVPEFEEREAARFAGDTWTEWQATPSDERARRVAHYRLSRMIAAHSDDAVATQHRVQSAMREAQREQRR